MLKRVMEHECRTNAEVFLAVCGKWPSILGDGFGDFIFMGDVIEYILADARLTGPAVDENLKASRNALHGYIREWGDFHDRLYRELCGFRFLRVRNAIEPRLLTTLILLARQFHRASQRRDFVSKEQFWKTFVTIQMRHCPRHSLTR